MARRTIRERVRSSDVAVGTSVHAPSTVQADNSSARNAAALGQALGLAMPSVEDTISRRRAKAVLAGTQAALSGREATPEELKRDAFVLGYERIRTDRQIVDLSRQADELYLRSTNKDNPAALQQELDGLFQSTFGNLDPEVDAERPMILQAMEGWNKIVAGINTKASEDAAARVQQDIEDDTISLAQDEYSRNAGLDLEALNERLFPLLGSQRSNEMIYKIVSDLAVRNGDPSLVDRIPVKWLNGSTAPGGDAKFLDGLRSTRQAAENQRAHDESLADKQAKLELEQRHEANARQMVADILGGFNRTQQVRELVANNELSADTARAIISFQGTAGDELDEGGVNNRIATQLEIDLRTGEADANDVYRRLDEIGYGDQGRREVTRLLDLARSVKDDRLKTADAQNWRDILKARTKPTQSVFKIDLDGELDRTERLAQAGVLKAYDEALLQGMSPTDAAKKALESMPDMTTLAPAGASPTSTTPEAYIESVMARVASGELTEEEAIAELEAP